MLVGLAECWPDLVMDDQLLLKSFISAEDAWWHACSSSQSNHKGSHNLVEALIDIYASSSDVCPMWPA